MSSFFREHGGGVELVAHGLSAHLAALDGWNVILAAHKSEASPPQTTGFEALPIRCWNGIERLTGLPLMIPHPVDLFRVLRTVGVADIVIIHEEIYLSNLILLIWSLLRRRPVFVVKHTGQLRFPSKVLNAVQSFLTRFLLRPLLARANRVVFVTDRKRARYDPEGALARAVVIENGVDDDLFHLSDAPRGNTRPRILVVGRFIDRKGMALIHRLAAASPDHDYHLIGWGPDDPARWNLANVEVERKPPRARIAEAFREADVSLFAGLDEGVPLVIIESLASGTPVVASHTCESPNEDLMAALRLVELDLDDIDRIAPLWRTEIDKALAESGPAQSRKLSGVVRPFYAETTVFGRYEALIRAVLNK